MKTTWTCTHTGWMLLAPLLLAEIESDAPVPIPRFGLEWWFDVNLWLNDHIVNLVISLIDERSVGYLFWGVRELDKPVIVEI